MTSQELEAELDKTLRGDQGAAQRIIDHGKAERKQLAEMKQDFDELQREFDAGPGAVLDAQAKVIEGYQRQLTKKDEEITRLRESLKGILPFAASWLQETYDDEYVHHSLYVKAQQALTPTKGSVKP